MCGVVVESVEAEKRNRGMGWGLPKKWRERFGVCGWFVNWAFVHQEFT